MTPWAVPRSLGKSRKMMPMSVGKIGPSENPSARMPKRPTEPLAVLARRGVEMTMLYPECCGMPQLEAGDILFFDGSHRAFMNSDVTVFFIDVLPRIKPGVIVHIHDIALPWDYGEFFKNWYWNETYMLAVYMMGHKHRIKPIAPTAFICRDVAFEAELVGPLIDLGRYNDGWKGGGAMWFTHTS